MAKNKKNIEVETPPVVKTRKDRTVNNLTRNVYYASGKKDKLTPKILIEGVWLKEIGFEVGKTYKLTTEKGLITLQING